MLKDPDRLYRELEPLASDCSDDRGSHAIRMQRLHRYDITGKDLP